jgi:hypothetical protein
MTLRVRSTTLLSLSRLISVSICLCGFMLLPVSQLPLLTWVELTEGECPEEGESSKEERVVCSSARRRLNDRRHSDLAPSRQAVGCRIVSHVSCPSVIVGHQFANGLRAPLLI